MVIERKKNRKGIANTVLSAQKYRRQSDLRIRSVIKFNHHLNKWLMHE
ncbi:hypothetical protein NBRC111894_569 [Sporolactobacillus inulinus]|uniref:Uncharacterized protein n=1 Tax=Sporolactobacillus inulinus TaxID=2078 RepID=A0A4Y1Z7Q4_9BACL|nr:hypothetical protein NBRC111894_569 [Sporolactobacillus inulinus]